MTPQEKIVEDGCVDIRKVSTDLIWADIKGFEGYYQVSNYGCVRSLDRTVVNSGSKLQILKGGLVKMAYDKDGYLKFTLHKDAKRYYKRAHRVVSETFIPNPENKPIPNHLNGIRDDNRVENLEWATSSENISHGKNRARENFKKLVMLAGFMPSDNGKKYCKELGMYI